MTNPSPRSNRARVWRAALAGGLTALAAAGCGTQAGVDAAAAAPVELRRTINVEVQALQPRRFTDVIRLTGVAAADREVTVATEDGGTVVEILVDKGAPVERGQVLLRLQDDLLRAQRDEAQASLALATEMWQRRRQLYEVDRIGTEGEYLEAKYGAEQAAARLAYIAARLAHTVVRAPFAGWLDARLAEVGSVLAPGQAVARILDLEPMKVVAGVPERYAADVAVGALARVQLTALADTCGARVRFVGAAVHPGNRTFPVELALDATAARVKPEMVADVILVRQVLDGVLVVPRQAVVRTEGGFAVFVVVGDGDGAVARARPVTLGPSANDEVVVRTGLAPADRLVVVGQQQVADGDRVRVVAERAA